MGIVISLDGVVGWLHSTVASIYQAILNYNTVMQDKMLVGKAILVFLVLTYIVYKVLGAIVFREKRKMAINFLVSVAVVVGVSAWMYYTSTGTVTTDLAVAGVNNSGKLVNAIDMLNG